MFYSVKLNPPREPREKFLFFSSEVPYISEKLLQRLFSIAAFMSRLIVSLEIVSFNEYFFVCGMSVGRLVPAAETRYPRQC